jgi:hypothetical protein
VAADQQQLLQQQWAALEQPQQQLLPHEDTLAFAQALRVLQQQPVFSQAALERTVEAIRADVSGPLAAVDAAWERGVRTAALHACAMLSWWNCTGLATTCA